MSGFTGFGITQEGFVMPQLTDIQEQINQVLLTKFGAGINLNPQSFFGQLSGTFSERELLVWQAMQDVYLSQNPDEAFGASLDNVGALRGILRKGPSASRVENVRLFGTSGTLIPANVNPLLSTQFSVLGSPSSIFALNSPVVLGPGANCVQLISFSSVPTAGTWTLSLRGSTTIALAHNASAAAVQAAVRNLLFCSGCTVTGDYTVGFTITFLGAGTGGLMVQPIFVAEGSLTDPSVVVITPSITTPGVDQASVTVVATEDGPIIANAGTLTVIVTPITGLTAVLNTQDAFVGQLAESDNAYRTRMNEELQIAGAATVEAIRSDLLQLEDVTTVLVFENVSDIFDIDGRPPHSFECVVAGGSDAEIAETIWLSKPAGIQTYGNTSFTITDSQGQTHVIRFSRPTAVPVYMTVNLTVDASYPASGDELVKEVLVNYGNSLGIGKELIVIPLLISQLAPIAGIQDAEILVGTTPGPTLPDNITPTAYQILTFDTANVGVNS